MNPTLKKLERRIAALENAIQEINQAGHATIEAKIRKAVKLAGLDREDPCLFPKGTTKKDFQP